MSKLAQKAPFHATDGTVYHDNSKCPTGRRVVVRQKGTGQKKHCPECGKLNAAP